MTDAGADRVYRVVHVADAEHLRALVKKMLERSGRFTVVGEAGDGEAGIEMATRLRPDLTLLDLSMPIMDGLEALPRVRAAVPESAVVVLSGFDGQAIASRVIASGARGYITKGIGPERLVAELLAVLEPEEVPPPGAEAAEARLTLAPELTSAREARRFLERHLVEWGAGDLVDQANLLTTELVTNAVVHARSGADVCLRYDEGVLRVEVADQGGGTLRMGELTSEAVSGRGLAIVEVVAPVWGTAITDAGKIVWFELRSGEDEQRTA